MILFVYVLDVFRRLVKMVFFGRPHSAYRSQKLRHVLDTAGADVKNAPAVSGAFQALLDQQGLQYFNGAGANSRFIIG